MINALIVIPATKLIVERVRRVAQGYIHQCHTDKYGYATAYLSSWRLGMLK